ncbi:outer membrane protein 30 3 [Helicobacter pylori Hp M6]|nr:outer membrane protein 30 3 [Helicobacter pylori Hp M6]
MWTYGVGMDALYNFINDKNTNFLGKNNKAFCGAFGWLCVSRDFVAQFPTSEFDHDEWHL